MTLTLMTSVGKIVEEKHQQQPSFLFSTTITSIMMTLIQCVQHTHTHTYICIPIITILYLFSIIEIIYRDFRFLFRVCCAYARMLVLFVRSFVLVHSVYFSFYFSHQIFEQFISYSNCLNAICPLTLLAFVVVCRPVSLRPPAIPSSSHRVCHLSIAVSSHTAQRERERNARDFVVSKL